MSYSKPFHSTLNNASTANVQEVMKFYNLGDKTFETDFSQHYQFHMTSFVEEIMFYQWSNYQIQSHMNKETKSLEQT